MWLSNVSNAQLAVRNVENRNISSLRVNSIVEKSHEVVKPALYFSATFSVKVQAEIILTLISAA